MTNKNLILAAIGGAAAGVALANIIGSEKGKAFLGKIGETATQFVNEHKDQLNMETISNLIMSKLRK